MYPTMSSPGAPGPPGFTNKLPIFRPGFARDARPTARLIVRPAFRVVSSGTVKVAHSPVEQACQRSCGFDDVEVFRRRDGAVGVDDEQPAASTTVATSTASPFRRVMR